MASTSDDWKSFFAETLAPDQYDAQIQRIHDFISLHSSSGAQLRPIVLISSGGTIIPLENRTVRFIDNFSIGTRGAASAEYFLAQGYAVIFLHRKGSLKPFQRHFARTNFLDMLYSDGNTVKVKDTNMSHIHDMLTSYQTSKKDNTVLELEFVTLSEYLFFLKGAAQATSKLENRVMFYLAAAVSDFYIPREETPEHKIPSGNGPIQISLHLVPKMLEPLVKEWAPKAFVVSFKLETDGDLLLKKAKQALDKYKHHVVVANMLDTRRWTVVMVTPSEEQTIKLSEEEQTCTEIESLIIGNLVDRHEKHRGEGS